MNRYRARGRLVVRGSETGVLALALAVAVCALLTLLVTIVVQVSSGNLTDSSYRLEQAQAFDAAEGGLDLVIGEIKQAGHISGLPCTLAKTVFASSPGSSSASATITYYSSYGSVGPSGKLTCTAGSGPSGSQVQAAVVVATGRAGRTSGGATAYAEAELQLANVTAGTVFDYALFSDQSLLNANNPTVDGNPAGADNANVYSNGSINCGNAFDVQGSVVLHGSFTGVNSCTVDGSIVATGNVALANNATVVGSVYAGGVPCASPPSTITLTNKAAIDQSAYACGAIVAGPRAIGHTTAANQNPLPAAGTVPTESLPTWTNPATDATAAAAWQAAGYAVKADGGNCAQVYSDISGLTAVTTPTVLTTSCALSWSSPVTIHTNVAIFATGGFTMTNNTSWQSDGTTRLLYFVVPSPQTCVAGLPGITLANNTSFAPNVNVLFYTPCLLTINNLNGAWGQMYAGQISFQNNFTVHFVPVPSPAAAGGGTYKTLASSLIFERQLVAPPTLAP
jgi:hypothetical protein